MASTWMFFILWGVLNLVGLGYCKEECLQVMGDISADGYLYVDGSNVDISFQWNCSTSPEFVSVRSGRQMLCIIRKNPVKHFTWESNVNCSVTGTAWTVRINLDDLTNMTIELRFQTEPIQYSTDFTVRLKRKESPKILHFTLKERNRIREIIYYDDSNDPIFVEENSTLTLACQWNPGAPASNATLNRDGEPLLGVDVYPGPKPEHSLKYTIDSFRVQDEGVYSCELGVTVFSARQVRIRGLRTPEDFFHTTTFRVLLGAIAFVLLASGVVVGILITRRGRAPGPTGNPMAEASTEIELTELPSPDSPYDRLGDYERSGDYTQLASHPRRQSEDQDSQPVYLEIIADPPALP